MTDDHKLHVIEPIVTSDKFEYGLHRLSVPGGWLYWLQPAGGAMVTGFVPFHLELVSGASAESLNPSQEELVTKIATKPDDVIDGAS
jgi:hypothetical protein